MDHKICRAYVARVLYKISYSEATFCEQRKRVPSDFLKRQIVQHPPVHGALLVKEKQRKGTEYGVEKVFREVLCTIIISLSILVLYVLTYRVLYCTIHVHTSTDVTRTGGGFAAMGRNLRSACRFGMYHILCA